MFSKIINLRAYLKKIRPKSGMLPGEDRGKKIYFKAIKTYYLLSIKIRVIGIFT